MRSTNLRNKPIDRRYLNEKDRDDYNMSGEYGNRASALARVRGYKGQMAYEANRPMNTQGRTPGTGGFNKGIGVQQARMRDYGASRRSEYQVKPPSNKGDIYGKQ